MPHFAASSVEYYTHSIYVNLNVELTNATANLVQWYLRMNL